MKTKLILFSSFTASLAYGHSGHPGPESHGDLTHLVLGLLAALPLLGGVWLVTRYRKATQQEKRVTIHKENPHG